MLGELPDLQRRGRLSLTSPATKLAGSVQFGAALAVVAADRAKVTANAKNVRKRLFIAPC